MKIFRFANCYFVLWNQDYAETIFLDGLKCKAQFSYDLPDIKRARDLGYSDTFDGVRKMHLEHELLHTILAEARGFDHSPTLRSVAGGLQIPREMQGQEEAQVLDAQRRLNSKTPKIDPEPYNLEGISGILYAIVSHLTS